MAIINLTPDEEKIAQCLTRDAWIYFNNMISHREMFHVKEIPMMPRGGVLELTDDAEIAQYYADFAGSYSEELAIRGWNPEREVEAVKSFVAKIEAAFPVKQGVAASKLAGSQS